MSHPTDLCTHTVSVRTVQADDSYAECEVAYVFSSEAPTALMLHLCIKKDDGTTVTTADAALHVHGTTDASLRICLQKPTLEDAVYTLFTTLTVGNKTQELPSTVFSITPCHMPIPDDAR